MSKSKVTNEALCAALLEHSTIRAAAEALGITERTIHNMMDDKEFKQMYEHAQADILENAVSNFQGKLIAALNCMEDIMQDKTVNAQTRLMAAQSIIKNTSELRTARDTLRNRALNETKTIDELFDSMPLSVTPKRKRLSSI